MTLQQYRKRKKLTLEAMAALIGLKSPTSVFNYENGQIPRKKIIDRIEEVTKGLVKAKDFYK